MFSLSNSSKDFESFESEAFRRGVNLKSSDSMGGRWEGDMGQYIYHGLDMLCSDCHSMSCTLVSFATNQYPGVLYRINHGKHSLSLFKEEDGCKSL